MAEAVAVKRRCGVKENLTEEQLRARMVKSFMNIDKIYDMFLAEGPQGISRKEFRLEFLRLCCPHAMREDLIAIHDEMDKQRTVAEFSFRFSATEVEEIEREQTNGEQSE